MKAARASYEKAGKRFEKKDLDKIVKELQVCLERMPEYSDAHFLYVKVEYNQRRYPEALERLLSAPAQSVAGIPADYHFFHGNILLRLNRLDEAVARCRQALDANPAHADASNNLASIYLSARQPKAALEVLERAGAAGATVNPELRQAVLAAQVR